MARYRFVDNVLKKIAGSYVVDKVLNRRSLNPVTNKAVSEKFETVDAALENKQPKTLSQTISGKTTVESALIKISSDLSNTNSNLRQTNNNLAQTNRTLGTKVGLVGLTSGYASLTTGQEGNYIDSAYSNGSYDWILRDWVTHKERQVFSKPSAATSWTLVAHEPYGYISSGVQPGTVPGGNTFSFKWTNDGFVEVWVDATLVLKIKGYITIGK